MNINLNDNVTNADLAALADWAHNQKYLSTHPGLKKGFAMIREGADLLLRRRASQQTSTKEGANG